jgi:hypothetical protein
LLNESVHIVFTFRRKGGSMAAKRIVLQFPESKAVSEVRYDPANKVAEYDLTGGGTYQSTDVPYGVISRWGRAKSAGKFYGEHVKGKFPTKRQTWEQTR